MNECFSLRSFGIASPAAVANRDFILLNKGNTNLPPVFFFHDVLGNAKQYVTLAQKWQSPFYGVEMSESCPISSVEVLASHYITAIEVIQPSGPYRLGGYSFGALLATEVARQLEAKHQSVSYMIAVDPPPFLALRNEESSFSVGDDKARAMSDSLTALLDFPGDVFEVVASWAYDEVSPMVARHRRSGRLNAYLYIYIYIDIYNGTFGSCGCFATLIFFPLVHWAAKSHLAAERWDELLSS